MLYCKLIAFQLYSLLLYNSHSQRQVCSQFLVIITALVINILFIIKVVLYTVTSKLLSIILPWISVFWLLILYYNLLCSNLCVCVCVHYVQTEVIFSCAVVASNFIDLIVSIWFHNCCYQSVVFERMFVNINYKYIWTPTNIYITSQNPHNIRLVLCFDEQLGIYSGSLELCPSSSSISFLTRVLFSRLRREEILTMQNTKNYQDYSIWTFLAWHSPTCADNVRFRSMLLNDI